MRLVSIVLVLLVAVWTSTEAVTKRGQFDPDAIVVNLFDRKAKRSFLKSFKPADGFSHIGNRFNFTDWVSGEAGEEFWGMTADFKAQKIFWNDFKQQRLYEYNAQLGETRTISRYTTAGLESIAYDRVTGVLYWTDSKMNAIFAIDKTFKYITRVKNTKILKPHAIAIHTIKRKMIYSKYRLTLQTAHLSQIMKCDLDGKREKTILAFPDVVRVVAITIDYKENRLIWVDQGLDNTAVVHSSNMNGLSRLDLFSSKSSVFADITRYKDFFAVADTNRYKSRYNIHIRYRGNTNPTSLKTNLLPRNIVGYFKDESFDKKVTNECEKARCGHICLASSKKRSVCKCHAGYRLVGRRTCVSDVLDSDHFIVLDRGNSRLFQFEFTNAKNEGTLAPKSHPTAGGRNVEQITAFAVDDITGELLYYDAGRGVFVVWNKFEVNFAEGENFNKVLYMQVDSCNKIVYWNTEEAIYSWKHNDLSFKILHRSTREHMKIRRFAMDFKNRNVFWTELNERTNAGSVMQLNYRTDNGKLLFQSTEALHAIHIERQANTLNMAAMSSGILVSIDLETIHRNVRAYTEDLSKYVSHISSIQDFVIVKDVMYLIDRQWPSLLKLKWKGDKLDSVSEYGRNRLFYPTVLAFVNQTKRSIKKSNCPLNPTLSPPTTKTTLAATTSEAILSTSKSSTTSTTSTKVTRRTTRPTTIESTTFPQTEFTSTPTSTEHPVKLFTTPSLTVPTMVSSTSSFISTIMHSTTKNITTGSTSFSQPVTTSSEAPVFDNSACDIILQFPGSEEEKKKAFELCQLFSV